MICCIFEDLILSLASRGDMELGLIKADAKRFLKNAAKFSNIDLSFF
jgi:hypothetical protein